MALGMQAMWPYLPEILAQPVPRYTSYPPATAFSGDVGAAQQAEALNAVVAGTPTSLYVHIPYCHSICWYCGCNTGLAGKAQRLTAYLEALESEIRLVSRMLGGRGRISRIALGGGSPNAIAPLAFVRLVDRLVTCFAAGDVPIAVEIDPRSFTMEWAMTLAIAGVSRVSFGVQSFDPDIQAAIGRIQPYALVETCVAALRARGVSSINFDLVYGLPMQTMARLEATLDQAIALRPDRIALFGYAHLPGMFARQRRIDSATLPDLAARFAMAAAGYQQLEAAGYVPIGFDHFALPHDPLAQAAAAGTVHRNFQGFTEDDSAILIGMGASAISMFPDRIIQNEKKAGDYRALCAAGQLAGTKGVLRPREAQARAAAIEALLCRGETAIDPRWSLGAAGEQMAALARAGLIALEEGRMRIHRHALPYARHVAATLDATWRPPSPATY